METRDDIQFLDWILDAGHVLFYYNERDAITVNDVNPLTGSIATN
jgi:hypothetical protein